MPDNLSDALHSRRPAPPRRLRSCAAGRLRYPELRGRGRAPPGVRRELPDDATIIYGVFTPVGEPGTSSPFGRMFVELVASRLVQHGVGVVEVRLRDAIAVREGGPYALSDDARDVARRVQARAALSGSYAVTSEYALVTARLIDVATGIVLSSWDKLIPIGYADYALFEMAPGWTRADRGFYAFR